MPPVDQTRTFEKRLSDFGAELGRFLDRVWRQRAGIDITSFARGTATIYGMYSGRAAQRAYAEAELKTFMDGLKGLAGRYAVCPQGCPVMSDKWSDALIKVYGHDLWCDFYHVLSTPNPAKAIRARVYVHAANPGASLEIMKVIVDQFGVNTGLWEAKTAGPGAVRLDTIVAYLYDDAARGDLVTQLKKTAASQASLFADSLPPLVKREGAGIGIADEPPEIEIFRGGGTQHSFGSFFSTLTWVALKNTPNVRQNTADGRHMLDNVLYSLRVLRVDPRNPQRFPEASTLEQWYLTSVAR